MVVRIRAWSCRAFLREVTVVHFCIRVAKKEASLKGGIKKTRTEFFQTSPAKLNRLSIQTH